MKLRKLISLISTLCIVSTYAFVPASGTTTAMAAAADVGDYITSTESPKGMWKSNATMTGSGTSSVECSGTSTGTMTSYPAFSFNTKALGSGTDTIMHIGWSVSNPNGTRIDLRYQDSKGKYDLLKDFNSSVDPTSYRVDWFLNLQDRSYRLYFDNKLHTEGSIQSGATTIKNLYLDVPDSGDYSFTVNDPIQVVYGEGAVMNDVVAYTFKNRSADNYYWSESGMGNIGGTDGKRIVGTIDWVSNGKPSYDGSNVIANTSDSADSGIAYRLRFLKSNGTNLTKGCLPQDAENDNIIHQSLNITPNLTSGNYAAIGFSGNNKALKNKYKFGENNGFVSGQSYHFDILVNNKNKEYWILVDGEKRANGTIGDSYLSSIYYTIGTAGTDTLALSNIVTKSYDYTVSMDDAIAIVKNPSNYNWIFDGFDLYNTSIASGYNTRNNHVSYTGNNSTGYTVTATADAAYWQFRLGNGNKVELPANASEDNIIHQHLSFTPYFASGNKLSIGVRGNDSWQDDVLTVDADNGFVSGTEYDLHIIINNKDRSYMFIVDGELKATGTTWLQRYPYWELVYYIDKSGDSMKLKNVTTKYYNSTVTMADLADMYMTTVYAKIESIAAEGSTITTNTKFMGPTTDTDASTKAIYALYDNAGKLAQLNVVDSAASLINGSENVQNFTIPDNAVTGDILKVRVFMWNMDSLTPLSNSSEATYTVE